VTNTESLHLAAADTIAEFGACSAAIRNIVGVPALRLLVITDPDAQILEMDAVPVEIDDPDGSLAATASAALREWHRHNGNAGATGAARPAPITVEELLTGFKREIPAWNIMDLR